MFAHVYFHRLVFLQKNKYKGGRKASLFFEARLSPGFFWPEIRGLSRAGTQVHAQGRKNMALERTRTQQDAKDTKEYAKGRKNVGVLSQRGG